MSEEQNDHYIAIARACLRAINNAATDSQDRAEQIHSVYQAIDQAFQSHMKDYQEQIRDLERILERIAEGELSSNQMIHLARLRLPTTSHASRMTPALRATPESST